MLMRQVREPVLVGCMLAGLGTSTVHALPQTPLAFAARYRADDLGWSVPSPSPQVLPSVSCAG